MFCATALPGFDFWAVTVSDKQIDYLLDDTKFTPEKRILYFDLETRYGASEVGGWANLKAMRLAVGVVYDSLEKKYIRYWEDDAARLVDDLISADLVVGFNHIQFDYGVLTGYTDRNLRTAAKSFDIMLDVSRRLGHRLSLNNLAQATLNTGKTADGLTSLQWWKDGKHEMVAKYCEADVRITKELFEHGLATGRLVYRRKNGETAALAVDWDIKTIIAAARRSG